MRILSCLAGMALACVLGLVSIGNAAAYCGPNALGTSRTITIDAKKHRAIRGTESTLGLKHKEVILTFDDGPIAGKTARILKALKKECVKATFFYVGKMARAYPKLVRRVVAQGHTLAHHTHNHNRLPKYSTAKASKLIDRGVSRLQKIAYGDASSKPRTPFFRYPYLARNKRTDRMLAKKGLIAFGANIDALDWKRVSPSRVHNRIMRRLRKEGRGIILMHDIQGRTAKMLPRLLRSLKSEGYKVVHMVPKGAPAPREEPIVVASLDVDVSRISKISKLQNDSAKLTTSGLENPSNRKGKSAILSSLKLDGGVRTAETSFRKIEPKHTSKHIRRTGITRVALAQGKTPATAPKIFKSQIKLRRANSKKKRSKRAVKRRSKKRNLIVLAGSRAGRTINTGGWKLRRSQWILR